MVSDLVGVVSQETVVECNGGALASGQFVLQTRSGGCLHPLARIKHIGSAVDGHQVVVDDGQECWVIWLSLEHTVVDSQGLSFPPQVLQAVALLHPANKNI